MPDKIALESVMLRYGAEPVLNRVSLTINKGEILIIGGRSGQGKSSLLEVCAGLVRPNAGRVLWDACDIATLTKEELLRSRRRSLGYLFQIHALISNFTAFNNIALPLRGIPELSEAAIGKRVHEAMEHLALFGADDKYPEALSAYECKAAALARALITDPSMLILDEPLSGIDPAESVRLLAFIEKHFRERGVAILMMSHQFSVWPELPVKHMMLKKGTLVPFPGENSCAGTVDNKERLRL
jgi:ABC-type transporter Mla maintaining outer membrane lipid asymmetry ATPase subunit MlaF